ncbi:MAG TPA: DUF2203 domain-containing protein [Chloroflexota bacterium]|nr:DUF2203 domain-containing protein [Chloroflexota bacterium]
MSEELARFFEPPEAEAMLPELDGLLAEAQALLTRLEEARRRLSEPARANGHVILNDSSAAARSNETPSIQTQLEGILQQIQSQGVIVRDIQMGLIDFPAVRDGQLIFLCWRRGEALRIDWWHPTNTGIAGRRPL